jgi:putative heme-binding domain-containing protein
MRPRPVPRIDGMNAEQLVALLESPSGFLRDRAQMTIVTRKLADAAPLRALALRLCETSHDHAVIDRLPQLLEDPSPAVRLQLACTLGEYDTPEAGDALARIAKQSADDPFLSAAIGSSLPRHKKAVLARVLDDAALTSSPLFHQLAQMAIAEKDLDTVAALLDRACGDDSASRVALARVADVLATRGLSAEQLAGTGDRAARLEHALTRGAALAANTSATEVDRLEGVNLLGRINQRRAEDLRVAVSLLSTTTPADLQLAALRAAARCATGSEDSSLPSKLLEHWSTLSPALRGAVADTLLPRESWALALAQSPAARDLDFSRRQRLLNHPSARVKEAAKATLAQATVNADRQKVIDTYQPALTLKGDPAHGQALFAEQCATCHRVGAAAVGHDIGPNLLTVRDWPSENLLTAILDPDRNVEPRFIAYAATLNDNSTLTGLLIGESAGNVILKTLDDQDHPLPRPTLKSLTSTERSLMPQGFESALAPQDVADLMSYLKSPTTGE